MKGTVDGKTPDSVSDAVTASISALTKNADGTWSGQLTFVSGKPASLAITAIPDGMIVLLAFRAAGYSSLTAVGRAHV